MIRIERQWRDLWIGVYWEKKVEYSRPSGETAVLYHHIYRVWICLIPCFPIRIEWTRRGQGT